MSKQNIESLLEALKSTPAASPAAMVTKRAAIAKAEADLYRAEHGYPTDREVDDMLTYYATA